MLQLSNVCWRMKIMYITHLILIENTHIHVVRQFLLDVYYPSTKLYVAKYLFVRKRLTKVSWYTWHHLYHQQLDTFDIVGHTTRNINPIRKISQVGVHHVPTKTIYEHIWHEGFMIHCCCGQNNETQVLLTIKLMDWHTQYYLVTVMCCQLEWPNINIYNGICFFGFLTIDKNNVLITMTLHHQT